jgi:hypothetical protein
MSTVAYQFHTLHSTLSTALATERPLPKFTMVLIIDRFQSEMIAYPPPINAYAKVVTAKRHGQPQAHPQMNPRVKDSELAPPETQKGRRRPWDW